MVRKSEKPAEGQRHIRVPDEHWKPFLAAARKGEGISGNAVLLRMIKDFNDEWGVFLADGVLYYECEECDQAHRLSGQGAPKFCSLDKAHSDRMERRRNR